MLKSLLLKSLQILVICLFVLPAYAQKAPTKIDGIVVDAFTRQAVSEAENVEVSLLAPDSTVVQSVKCIDRVDQGSGVHRTYFAMHVPEQKGTNFILRLTCKGYQTTEKRIKLAWRKKQATITFWGISMRRLSATQERQLGEATVTATKIKFYTKGDTLVYNASAFQLQEGSMLDALVGQLPGVELKPDGRIMVNGKFVESLLLNGRDFFKGDNTVLLDNLPAYMVQQVQVYNKESEESRLSGQKVDDGQLVMDVKLKKQYSIGWLANTEWGYGTEKRYLGRLFAMRYTPQSRVSFFGNLNNVNDRRKPDGNGGWGDFDPTGGLTATKRAGLDYNIFDKRDRFELSGNAGVNYSDNDNVWGGSATNFLAGGDTYESRHSANYSSNLSVSTSHELKFKKTGKSFSLSPWFNYYKNDYSSTYLNGTFSSQPLDDYAAVIDSLFSPAWTTTVRNLIKRNGEWAQGNGHGNNGGLGFWSYLKMPFTTDGVSIEGSVSYSNSKSNSRDHFTYNWYEGNALNSDYRNRYNSSPANDFNYFVSAKYFWHLGKEVMLNPRYVLQYKYASGDQMRYSLATESDEHDLNWLPSQMESLLQAIDSDNSYQTRLHQYSHDFSLDLQWNHTGKTPEGRNNSSWRVQVKPSLSVERNRFSFIASPETQKLHKNYLLPSLQLSVRRITPGQKHELTANASITSSSPSMLNMVEKRFTADPLNITLGNPDLKQRTDYKASFRYENAQWLRDKEKMLYGEVGIDLTNNAVAVSYTYDRNTGVRTNEPVNVNGNWDTWFAAGYTTPVDKKRRLTFSTDTRANYYHIVDFASSSQATQPVRVTTDNCYVSETAKFNYRYKKVNIGVSGSLSYNYATADRSDFSDVNTWNFRYGANAVVDLPWQMQVSTELTMFSRRGYESHEMNRNDLVWNARFSKSVWHSRITFMLDAWDILGNLSNVSSGVNSQNRWEYYYNVIPRYVMLRVVYRFDLQPKKK